MAIAIPLHIAFIDEMQVTLILEILSLIIQAVVVFVNFRTPIYVKGVYTLNLKAIIRNYFNNGLIYDILGLLPLNLILGYF